MTRLRLDDLLRPRERDPEQQRTGGADGGARGRPDEPAHQDLGALIRHELGVDDPPDHGELRRDL